MFIGVGITYTYKCNNHIASMAEPSTNADSISNKHTYFDEVNTSNTFKISTT